MSNERTSGIAALALAATVAGGCAATVENGWKEPVQPYAVAILSPPQPAADFGCVVRRKEIERALRKTSCGDDFIHLLQDETKLINDCRPHDLSGTTRVRRMISRRAADCAERPDSHPAATCANAVNEAGFQIIGTPCDESVSDLIRESLECAENACSPLTRRYGDEFRTLLNIVTAAGEKIAAGCERRGH